MTSVAVAAELSTQDIERVVWPILRQTMGGKLTRIEKDVGTASGRDLDVDAGIDFYHRLRNGEILRTIATRVQWRYGPDGPAPWAKGKSPMTFTIRPGTELPKRQQAIDDGGTYPNLTLQAYLERPGGPCENFAWCRTADLYDALRSPRNAQEYSNADGSKLLAIKWFVLPGFRWFRENRPAQMDLFAS
jgi:hypothetical protein